MTDAPDPFLADCAALLDKPRITVPDVVPLVYRYYRMPGNSNGGAMHIFTEDGNVKDQHIDFCIERAIDNGDRHGMALAYVIRRMSKTQRTKISRGSYYPWPPLRTPSFG